MATVAHRDRPPIPEHVEGARRFVVTPYHRHVPEAVLLADIQLVARRLNRSSLAASAYDHHGRYSSITIAKRFGSWSAALARIGLEPAHIYNVTREAVLQDVQQTAKKLGTDRVGTAYYIANGKYSLKVVFRHYKNWQTAIEAAGFKPWRYRPQNDADLFADLRTVWETLGRQPRQADIGQPVSKFSLRVYVKRFGNFRNALNAFERAMDPQTGKIKPEHYEPANKRACRFSRAISWRLRYMILRRDNFRCVACGRSPATHRGLTLQIDHKKAWSRGGKTEMNNLQTLCHGCNAGKSDSV